MVGQVGIQSLGADYSLVMLCTGVLVLMSEPALCMAVLLLLLSPALCLCLFL